MKLIPPEVSPSDGVIALRLREAKDRAAIIAASHDPETRRWLDDEPIPSADARLWQDARETWARGERAPFVIADPESDRALGLVSLRVVADGTGSVAVSVFPEVRGQGIASAALRLIARWAILEAGFSRVEAEADVANTASSRAIEKAGFVYEGILRRHCETRGIRHDCKMFAIVRDDPPT